VLEYLHVPHDLPLAPQRQVLLAQSRIKDKDLDDDTPDHPGEPLETAELNTGTVDAARPSAVARRSAPASTLGGGTVVQAAAREPLPSSPPGLGDRTAPEAGETKLPASGTVVLDVEQGGIEVPSFVGKTFRSAIEAAQDVGLQLDAVGSGLARQQSPAAGSHVPAGSRVTVQFGR
jgi:cell division protein FtsI (penicillin-binding protein 3)